MSNIVKLVPKTKARNRKEGDKMRDIIKQSELEIKIHKQNGSVHGVEMEFHGKIAIFPSKSNITRRRGVYDAKRPDMDARLRALNYLFVDFLTRKGWQVPAFGQAPTVGLFLCAHASHIPDTHNQVKALGDWLEEVGIINNDRFLTLLPDCKADYTDTFDGFYSSSLILVRKEAVRSLLRETWIALWKVADNQCPLYG